MTSGANGTSSGAPNGAAPVPAGGDDVTRDGLAAVAAILLAAALIVFLVSRIV